MSISEAIGVKDDEKEDKFWDDNKDEGETMDPYLWKDRALKVLGIDGDEATRIERKGLIESLWDLRKKARETKDDTQLKKVNKLLDWVTIREQKRKEIRSNIDTWAQKNLIQGNQKDETDVSEEVKSATKGLKDPVDSTRKHNRDIEKAAGE
jgi:hypothetical protein